MPYASALATDINGLPAVQQAQLLADVAVTPVNTYVDVLTFGTIQPGTYLISGWLTMAQITATAVLSLKWLAGAAILAATEGTFIIGAGSIAIPAFPVVLGAAAVVKLQAASTVLTSTIKKVILNNGVGTDNFSSNITIVRVS